MTVALRGPAAVIGIVLAALAVDADQVAPRDAARTARSTSSVRGVVTSAETGDPLRSADVRLSGGNLAPSQARWAVSGADGRYEIAGLQPGQYTVTASKAGYVRLSYGQTRVVEGARPVEVPASQVVDNIDFALPRGAVIVVRLADQSGAPVPGYQVRAYQPRVSANARSLAPVAGEMFQVTDDRGELRLFGLAPGSYYLGAMPGIMTVRPLSARRSESQTFYPGTASDAEAQPVSVALGEEVVAAFALANARTARIKGTIAGSGPPSMVSMMRRSVGSSSGHPVSLLPDGTFIASGLPPAEYVLTAQGKNEAGTLRFQVSGEDIDGLLVTMKPAATLRGRFTFDPEVPGSRWPRTVGFRPIFTEGTGLSTAATVSDDWTFEMEGVTGTGVLRFVQPPAGWFLKAVLLDGVDVTDTPMEFTAFERKRVEVQLTQRTTRVAGTVSDGQGRRTSDSVAVVFPEDRQQWTSYSRAIAAARADQQGRFLMRGLPPGRYLIAAVDYLEPGAERDLATLERLRRVASQLVLTDGESQTVDLRITP